MQQCPVTGYKCAACTLNECTMAVGDSPAGVHKVVAEINARLPRYTKFKAEAYLQISSEGPDEWRIKIVDGDYELCRHIFPDKADDHTIMLLMDALERWGHHRFNAGKDAAVDKLAQHFKSLL